MKISIIGGGPGGLYFALLAKKRWPAYEITVYERNRFDDTFGFGVVFSDETLGIFQEYDEPSYEAIRRNFAYWDDVDIVFKGKTFRVAGNGFAGCSRKSLLLLLQSRCHNLGVDLTFEYEFDPVMLNTSPFKESDLIIAADGINSRIRTALTDHFGTSIDNRKNVFCWVGSTKEFDAFKYFFRETAYGPIVAHCYQYEDNASTWVIETSEETWRGLGFDKLDDKKGEHLPLIEEIFAAELDGHSLIDNRSLWRHFPMIRNQTWIKDNVVLLGDAKTTAHYSIGSGTKLAMEDAIGLFEALCAEEELDQALQLYQENREDEVGRLQHAADVSLQWFEAMDRHWDLEPEQFAFGVMSRSKQVTYENLILRDPSFVDRVRGWFNQKVRDQGFDVPDDTPPMFTPFKLRDLVLPNRVVVSPMAQYSAVDGLPNEWHLVHLGSRALGGAGLMFVEMTCVSPTGRITPGCTGIWNEEQCAEWAKIVDFVHQNSHTKLCMQIGHSGRKGSTRLAWDGIDLPLDGPDNWPLISASPIPYKPGVSQTPREMTQKDMDLVVRQFTQSAEYANQAGFDMLEVHMAHGYLLASFISPLTNIRQDEFGGSIENRLRFPLRVFAACRAVWPDHKPISVRISATDWAKGGLSEADLVGMARMLKQAGVDLIDVSSGQTVDDQKPTYGRMYQTPFADIVRQEAGIPTMSVGNIYSPDHVNTILLQGRADLVALARLHLSTPFFTHQAAAWYDFRGHDWPKQYHTGRNQAFQLAQKERDEYLRMRAALRPPTHQVQK
ncbi:MAG: bifunctional salicylyl-CoA 5-hydroxylase/oxidoreductase [Ardenticatenaceae bacterium]|nr:bifunctional salicylyl-CoA 5-hydroxylase/oxidoreductase [Ardenticatenaceae bacterium]